MDSAAWPHGAEAAAELKDRKQQAAALCAGEAFVREGSLSRASSATNILGASYAPLACTEQVCVPGGRVRGLDLRLSGRRACWLARPTAARGQGERARCRSGQKACAPARPCPCSLYAPPIRPPPAPS